MPEIPATEADDFSGVHLQRRRDTAFQDRLALARERSAETPTAKPEAAPPPSGRGFFASAARGTLETAGAVARAAPRIAADVARGVVEAPTQALGGVRDAAQEALEGIDSLANWLNEHVADLTIGDPEDQLRIDLPEIPKAASVTGSGVRSISQFLTGFVPALRGIKAVAPAASVAGRIAQIEAAAAGATAVVFDPQEERLSNLIQSVPALKNPVNEYLAAEPGDTDAEGRLKNATEGLGLGLAAEGLFQGVRALRAVRRARAAREAPPTEEGVPPPTASRPKSEPSIVLSKLGDPGKPLLIKPAKPSPIAGALPFQMNWARYTSSEDIEETVKKVAREFAGEIDEARRGRIPDEELKVLADRLGMTPEELVRRQPGGTFNAERILAAKAIVEASAEKLIELGRVAVQSSDLADIAAFMRMRDIHVAIQKQFQGAASEAGRALRALQVPVGSKARQVAQIEEMFAGAGGISRARSFAQALTEINDPNQINRVVRDSFGKRFADAVIEAWYFALLSGPKTHAVNITSSAMNALYQIPLRFLAARIGKARGTEGVAAGEATEMLVGMIGALDDALKASARALRTGEPTDVLGKVEARTQRAITAENFSLGGRPGSPGWIFAHAVDGIGAVLRTTTRLLMAEDEFFRTIGKSAQIRALALRQVRREGLEGEAAATRFTELTANPTDDMLEASVDFGRELTYTTPLGERGQTLQRFINSVPVLKFVAPFVRTPTNLVKFAFKASPLAPAARSVRQDIARGGAEGDMALARMAMGSGIMLVASDLALRDLVTGSGPTDPELRATWLRTHQPYSVKIGDTWYSYNRLDPFGMMVGVAADYASLAGELGEKDADELIAGAAMATSKSVFSKTWLRGPSEMVEALSDPDRYGARWVQRTVGTFLMPTGFAQFARDIDPVWRDVQSTLDAIKSRTPGWSDTLEARRNLWGEKILLEGGLGPDIVSPIYKYGVKDSPVDTYMFENEVNVAMPARMQLGVELHNNEYWRFVELAGNAMKDPATGMGAYDSLNAIIAGEHPLGAEWAGATDGPEGGRALMIRTYVTAFRKGAQDQLLSEFPELRQRVMDRLHERGRALEETIVDPLGGTLP